MKVLVLGGTRFVGLRLVRELAGQGHEIALLNRGRSQAQIPSGIKRLLADRRNPEEVKAALRGHSFDVVFDMTGYQVRNLDSVVDILSGNVGHYLFQSTCGAYQESQVAPILEHFPLRQPVPGLSGPAAYEFEKAECEIFFLQACRERGFPVTIFRCPVIYGPENWMDEREGSFFYRTAKGRKIIIPGDGLSLLHMVHVGDVAKAHLSAAGKKNTVGRAYNIASAEAITINGYVSACAKAVGTEARTVHLEPSVVKTLGRPIFPFPWDTTQIYGIHKAKEDFNFWPRYGFDEGLADTYRWWAKERGPERIQFVPGKLGYDVDLAYEDEIVKKFG